LIFCNPNITFLRGTQFFYYLRGMKRLKVFNPEHDLALANGDKHYIAPRNIRDMARDLSSLMDYVVGPEMPWGWNAEVVERLCKSGVSRDSLPTDEMLKALRARSERITAHHLLQTMHHMCPCGLCGVSYVCRSVDEVNAYAAMHGHVLMKAPLSGSGKGLRHSHGPLDEKQIGWCRALIKRHGYLTVEPYYDKVQDFAMEFCVQKNECRFVGYSLFATDCHGHYDRNILMSDCRIEAYLAGFISQKLLHDICALVVAHYKDIVPDGWDTDRFPLFFGIDMMIVNIGQQAKDNNQQPLMAGGEGVAVSDNRPDGNSEFKLHPCVEINLRLNMGIVAHSLFVRRLSPEAEGVFRLAFFNDSESLQVFVEEQKKTHPMILQDGKMLKGYLPLTPVGLDARYHAYIVC